MNFQILHCQLQRHFLRPVVRMCLATVTKRKSVSSGQKMGLVPVEKVTTKSNPLHFDEQECLICLPWQNRVGVGGKMEGEG